jgi:hypothetical protein
MPSFDSVKNLQSYIEKQTELFLVKAGERVRDIIKDYIQERFYNQYSPSEYIRTYQLLNSVTCTDVVKVGNTYQLEVYLNTEGVNYNSWFEGHRESIEPEIIFEAASEGWHGATQTDGRFIEEAKYDLQNGISYNILLDFQKYMISKGINVKGNISIK